MEKTFLDEYQTEEIKLSNKKFTISDNNEKLVLVKQKTFASHMTSEGFFFNTYIISER